MGDGAEEEKVKAAEAKFIGKAGWLKKLSGKFLGSYKDRYILVEKTEIVVYENEDLGKCIERVDLEKYHKCCGTRGAFQKKNRLVLVPVPKSKVNEIKLQVSNLEEKEAWIAAISDAINRAKNKIFDEVKVDESCSLDHMTRSRPKGSRSRRPPTRIHMKEAANDSSDGILRLDLDAFDSMPNGTCELKDDTKLLAEARKPPMPPTNPSKDPSQGSGQEAIPQKMPVKPPMPPSSESKPTASSVKEATANDHSSEEVCIPSSQPVGAHSMSSDKAENDETSPVMTPSPPSKDQQPPTPPSKDKKPTLKLQDEVPEQPLCLEDTEEERPVESPPEDHPSVSTEDAVSVEDMTSYSPKEIVTPSKEVSTEPNKEDVGLTTGAQESTNVTPNSLEEQEFATNSSVIKEDDTPQLAILSDQQPMESCAPNTRPPEQLPEHVKKGPAPPAPPKKKPLKSPHVTAGRSEMKTGSANVLASTEPETAVPPVQTGNQTVIAPVKADSETKTMNIINLEKISCSTESESVIPPGETVPTMNVENEPVEGKSMVPDDEIVHSTVLVSAVKEDQLKKGDEVFVEHKADGFVIIVSSYDSVDKLDLSLEKMDRDEMRSSDSGQHSDDEMGSGDNIRASTTALSGSQTRLDEEISEYSTDLMDNQNIGLDSPPNVTENDENLHDMVNRALIPELGKACSPICTPSIPRKSLSLGDLLSISEPVEKLLQSPPNNDINELHKETLPDLKATEVPFDEEPDEKGNVDSSHDGGADMGASGQDLMAEVFKKHQKAEQILREAKILKVHTARRKSW